MKKSMLILLICATLTACGNQETQTAITKNVATDTSAQVQSETTTETALPSETVATTVVTTETKTTSTNTLTATEITSSEKKNDVTTKITTAKVTSAETAKSTPITTTQLKPTTTASTKKSTTTTITTTTTTVPKTTIITTTEVTPPQTEPTQNNLTDYEKALEIYEYMRTNGSGTCVQHSYQTYEMCISKGLECYFAWTENKLYGHVANVVKLDGVWYVMDTQAGCFLTENMCGFTEIVDANENYIASADVISSTRYE